MLTPISRMALAALTGGCALAVLVAPAMADGRPALGAG